eukprot:11195993-Lingulodinium_polyedra.AAC.1
MVARWSSRSGRAVVGQWSCEVRARSGQWSPSTIGSYRFLGVWKTAPSLKEAQHTPMTKVGGY